MNTPGLGDSSSLGQSSGLVPPTPVPGQRGPAPPPGAEAAVPLSEVATRPGTLPVAEQQYLPNREAIWAARGLTGLGSATLDWGKTALTFAVGLGIGVGVGWYFARQQGGA